MHPKYETHALETVLDLLKHYDSEQVFALNYVVDGVEAKIKSKVDNQVYILTLKPQTYARHSDGSQERRSVDDSWEQSLRAEDEAAF